MNNYKVECLEYNSVVWDLIEVVKRARNALTPHETFTETQTS